MAAEVLADAAPLTQSRDYLLLREMAASGLGGALPAHPEPLSSLTPRRRHGG